MITRSYNQNMESFALCHLDPPDSDATFVAVMKCGESVVACHGGGGVPVKYVPGAYPGKLMIR